MRLKQGSVITDFSIYIDNQVKEKSDEDDTQMFVMRKKTGNADDTKPDRTNLISTVGLFTPNLQVEGESVRGCFYTIRSNEGTLSGDFRKILDAIDKDVKNRPGCDFKILLASLYIDGTFNFDKELYDNYKYLNLDCKIVDEPKKYKYNVPRSRDLSDYIIVLEKSNKISFGDCNIELPGDDRARGLDKLSDFEELSTHYPLSTVIRDTEAG